LATDGESSDLVDAFASGGARAGENHLPDEVRFLVGDHLSHEAAQRESKEIDLIESQGPDEGNGVPRHRGDRGRCPAL
jgi:hypothetical protein